MADDALCWTSASELAGLIRRKAVSPVEVVDVVLARIDRLDPTLNAFVTVTAEAARRAARLAERALAVRRPRLGPLHGVPFSVKDLVATRGVRTTFGTPLYRDHVPEEDAPVVERLRAAGAILVGKTNTPAFGWIGATHNLLGPPTRNPWKLDRTPGGSSGGASAAVAAGLAPLAVGTDGGGSIRIPAAFAGIVGHKPSFGRVPVYPPSAAWSLSHVGPMTRTVADAALMLQVIAGPDERDGGSLPAERADYGGALRRGVRGLRIAYAEDLGFGEALDPEVRTAVARAARVFRTAGARVETVRLAWPSPRDCWRDIFYGGIGARLGPHAGRTDALDAGLLAIVQAAGRMPPGRFVEAWFERLAWGAHPRALFQRHDLLLTPTVACPAFAVGLDEPGEVAGRAVGPTGWTPFTYPFNLTGQPACSVPCGFTRQGLPVGLQIVGRRFEDATVLRAAAAFERARPWSRARPPLP
jgi:aspartyl-tRNA(Asn)/glutamyl-tRNA(Gln) amidotransferase subunit A